MAEIALDITLGVEGQHKDIEIAVGRRRKYMTIAVEKNVTPLPEYEGPYDVVPRLYYGQLLETAGKNMRDNVNVDPIPVTTTTNPYGGKTVVIG